MRRASGLGARLDTLDVDREVVSPDVLDRYAAVVVGGSPYSITDAEREKSAGQLLAERQLAGLAERALERDRPLFFTCFGIGVLTRVLGGVVDRSHPETVSVAESRLTEAGSSDPVAGVLPPRFDALTGHKESAPEPPPGAVLLATNDASPVQLYRVGSVLASQFHPEPSNRDFVQRATIYARSGYFPEDQLRSVTAQLLSRPVVAPPKLLRRFIAVHDLADAEGCAIAS